MSETGIPDLAKRLNEHLATDQRITLEDGAIFIAYNDTARALREIAFKRALIADLLAEEHLVLDADEIEWQGCKSLTCEAADCTCGRDKRVERRLRLLTAAIYEEGEMGR